MKVLAAFFLLTGLFLLVQFSLPILKFQLLQANFKKTQIVSPQSGQQSILGVSVESADNFPAFVSNLHRQTKSPFGKFALSVSSIKLSSLVEVDSNDLSAGLAHLPGSALPGEKGNVFISGHSAPPLFSHILKAEFAELPQVKNGDKIELTALGADYQYKVVDIKIVDPKDISVILPPDSDGRYVSLMTCVPPGLNSKRLVILGKLVE